MKYRSATATHGPEEHTRVSGCSVIGLKSLIDDRGALTLVDGCIPFAVKNIFYITHVPRGATRGGHAHRRTRQFIIALTGSFDATVDDALDMRTFRLDSPCHGLYVPPMIWLSLSGFSGGSTCLAFTSDHYDESDYIRTYADFAGAKK